jgi:hypothetical protein
VTRATKTVAEALAQPDTYCTAVRDVLQAERDLPAAGLTDAGFRVHPPQGTYSITTDIAGLAPETDALAFCRTLPAVHAAAFAEAAQHRHGLADLLHRQAEGGADLTESGKQDLDAADVQAAGGAPGDHAFLPQGSEQPPQHDVDQASGVAVLGADRVFDRPGR